MHREKDHSSQMIYCALKPFPHENLQLPNTPKFLLYQNLSKYKQDAIKEVREFSTTIKSKNCIIVKEKDLFLAQLENILPSKYDIDIGDIREEYDDLPSDTKICISFESYFDKAQILHCVENQIAWANSNSLEHIKDSKIQKIDEAKQETLRKLKVVPGDTADEGDFLPSREKNEEATSALNEINMDELKKIWGSPVHLIKAVSKGYRTQDV
ncbi:hypothetical protein SUVZ_04G2680 [Saccharomyces uvarum]|uniref:Uncharacterized protein n=1 Tax=Saccharomyces uvarum TaxID=230603 RepID=A0ABN8WU95_SACUV|nr:hypothetical protein SUVZ_04G2680 [Saccharomyces uvarum]